MQSFVELVHSNNGNAQKGIDRGGSQDYKSKHVRSSNKREKKSASMVPSHLIQTDVSNVKGTTHVFTNMMFYFVNVPSSYSLEYFHKMVTENGGSFSMNLNDSVTHCVAAERKGIKYQAAILRRDIIHYSWVLDCCSLKRLLHLQPKYFLFLADSSKKKLQEEMDVYSDSYYWDLDIRDIKQLLCNMDESLDKKSINYYKKKYHLSDKWSLFQDCCMYFYNQVHTGFPETQRCLLHGKRLQVVRHQWLEDSLENGNKLQGGPYSLKPVSFEESNNEQSGQGLELEVHPVSESIGQKFLASPDRGSKRKRGGISQTGSRRNAKRTGFQPARKTRTRLGNRPPKICERYSDRSDSSDRSSKQEGFKLSKCSPQTHGDVAMEKDGKRKTPKMTKGSAREYARQEESGHVQGIETDEMMGREEKEKAEEAARIHIEEENKGPSEKLEMRIDPVQAILLDMIPSLSQKAETDKRGKAVVDDKKSDKYPDAMPAKKKVSYKYVADQLLEDW